MLLNKFSYSKIQTFIRCPYKFKKIYLDGLKDLDVNVFTQKGNYIHSLIYNFPKIENIKKEKYNLLNENEIKKCEEIFFENLRNDFFNQFLKNSISKERIFYLDKNLKISTKENYFISGIIDNISLINNRLYVIDWKTNKEKIKDKLQLVLYSVFCFEEFKEFDKINFCFYYLNFKEIDKIEIDRKEIDSYKNRIINIIKKINETKIFKKKLDKENCKNCKLFFECLKDNIKKSK